MSGENLYFFGAKTTCFFARILRQTLYPDFYWLPVLTHAVFLSLSGFSPDQYLVLL
jgi:hypothetical protein